MKPSPAIAALRRRKERGRLAVNEFQAVPEFPNVWAAGDCTAVLDDKTGTSHPPNAQHGLREGLIAAKSNRSLNPRQAHETLYVHASRPSGRPIRETR